MNLISAEILTGLLTEAANEEATRVLLGAAEDWADYKRQTGIIEGLEKAKRIVKELTEDKK